MDRARRPTLDDVSWPLRTQRLTLRRARPDDLGAVFAYRRLEPVGRFLTTVQTDLAGWERSWRARTPSTIVVEHDGQVIGDTRIVVEDAHAQSEISAHGVATEAELMWAFNPTAHGQGFATETVGELIRISFAEFGLRRLVAHCYADNEPSWRVMERVGMRREAHEIASTLHRDGTWRDFYHYGLLASEWDACPRG
jgi:RimJ/RimL family protein N-acetyltransferase